MILHFSKAILLLSGIQLLSRKPPQSPPSQPGLFSADNISILRTQPMDEGSENPRYTSLTEMKMKIAAIVLRYPLIHLLQVLRKASAIVKGSSTSPVNNLSQVQAALLQMVEKSSYFQSWKASGLATQSKKSISHSNLSISRFAGQSWLLSSQKESKE
ncbi:PREDICTED: uncharacterized protein LOC109180555 isoform X1 [Ipomoea nil]|uniref:uncharacterized protein LOC109180555 isoform X1 n=1 Tax=Ipomoea nil TaxID=35883 RepID=UPI000901D3FA|nr:PREDICTED: uncharacterized protein LOC109180555 isoform X1 [Ipomoea nil]XP_019185735.1 PREDICTED: uncharacterized protein LOC109180555 isoform X1 [Ipomoea nil]